MPQPLDRRAGEQPVRARDRDVVAALGPELVEQLDDRATGRDLVVEHDRPLAGDVTDDRLDDDPVVGEALLAARRHRHAEQPGELVRRLGVAEVRRHDDGVRQVAATEVVGELADGRQVIDGDAEEPVHLRGVQRHRDHAPGAGRDEQIGDQTSADRDARGVLLVRAGVRVVRDHGRDLGRRRPTRRVEHEQQLHQVLLRRRDQRLDDVHVALGGSSPAAAPGGSRC